MKRAMLVAAAVLAFLTLVQVFGQYTPPPPATTNLATSALANYKTLHTWVCAPASGSGTAYDCSTHLTLLDGTAISNTAPQDGQVALFYPDVNNTGATTLKTDGATNVSLMPLISNGGRGATFSSADLSAGLQYVITYHGSAGIWVVASGIQQAATSTGLQNAGTTFKPVFEVSNPPATQSTCASAASPAVCGSSAAGSVVIAASATTVTVNTTVVDANSQISVWEDSSLGTLLSVTCNTQSTLVIGSPRVSARVAGTSFTITLPVGPTSNPACFGYTISN